MATESWGPDLILLLLGENVDNPVDRALGRIRVQGAEDDVAGLGGGDGRLDRRQVSHLADEDDVRVHTEGPADGLGEIGDVDPDLALIHERLLMLVVILDRVFDRDDVPVHVVVDPVDHARQARRLARPRRAGDEDQASGASDQLFHDGRQAELGECEELVRDPPEDQADVPALLVDRDAESGGLAEGKPEVAPPDFLQLLLTTLGRDALHQGRRVGGFEHLRVERDHVPAEPEHRLRTDGQVEVAGPLGHDRLEQLVDQQRAHERLAPFAGISGRNTPNRFTRRRAGGVDFVSKTRCPPIQEALRWDLRRRPDGSSRNPLFRRHPPRSSNRMRFVMPALGHLTRIGTGREGRAAIREKASRVGRNDLRPISEPIRLANRRGIPDG